MTSPATNLVALIPPALDGKRLDAALATLLEGEGLSRARLQALIAEGAVTRDGKPVTKTNGSTKAGETYHVAVPPPIDAIPQAQDIDLNIVFEDDALLVIDKPAGLVVHPAAGNPDHTLVNALLAHCGDSLSGIGGVRRPGIVHRLDKDTSGLMVVAKNDLAHHALSAQFAAHDDGSRELSRTYQAIVFGMAPAELTIETQIGRDIRHRQRMAVLQPDNSGEAVRGKHAITHMRSLRHFGRLATLVECVLETGRTHQIRVHMQHIGLPIVGDPLYGKRRGISVLPDILRGFPRQALHAAALSFSHPVTGKKLKFYSKLPHDMDRLLSDLEKR